MKTKHGILAIIGGGKRTKQTLSQTIKNDTKIKVTSADIVVHGTADKPYYEIKYHDVSDGKCHIGYSSYDLHNVFKWREECFEIVR